MAIVPLWCSAARSAFSAPNSRCFWYRQPRTQYKPPTASPRCDGACSATSASPLFLSATHAPTGFQTGYCFGTHDAKSVAVTFGRKNPRSRHGGTEHSRKHSLESPADFVTRAPNFSKLGQAGRARQDLV